MPLKFSLQLLFFCYNFSGFKNYFTWNVYYSYDELKKYIEYYNHHRIKEALGWLTSVDYRLSQSAV
ncbi:IS3 family transposase [Pectinatus frisingensis]|uniref:IS3 family transposase n=1 Tax=Pectinatus frisingensis TaxID=865 RepID=UPI0018C6E0FA